MRHSHCAVQDQVPVLQMSGLEYNGIAWWQIFLHWDSNPAHSHSIVMPVQTKGTWDNVDTVCVPLVQYNWSRLPVLQDEWAGFESQCRNICHQAIPLYSSPLICKTGGYLVLYCTMAVSHCPLMVVVGLRVPTPAMGGTVGTSCELLARALAVYVVPAHRTCLVHRWGMRLCFVCVYGPRLPIPFWRDMWAVII